jgi:hypothetical protein
MFLNLKRPDTRDVFLLSIYSQGFTLSEALTKIFYQPSFLTIPFLISAYFLDK